MEAKKNIGKKLERKKRFLARHPQQHTLGGGGLFDYFDYVARN